MFMEIMNREALEITGNGQLRKQKIYLWWRVYIQRAIGRKQVPNPDAFAFPTNEKNNIAETTEYPRQSSFVINLDTWKPIMNPIISLRFDKWHTVWAKPLSVPDADIDVRKIWQRTPYLNTNT